jgi:hypothetical protein
LVLAGCGATDPSIPVRRDLIEANSKIDHLAADNLALQNQLRARDEQIAALQALGAGKRIEKLYTVKRIEIGDRSGGVGLDDKPGDSGVKVYLEPIDQYGSSIKAPGDVTVELYDLAAAPGENLLCSFRFGVEEVGKKWINGFLTQQYVFECPWDKNPPRHNQITIRVNFIDYLTGQSFAEQKAVKVTLRPTTQPASQPTASSGPTSTTSASPAQPPTATSAPQPSTVPAAAPSLIPAVPAPAATPAPSPSPAPAPATESTGWMPAPMTPQSQPASGASAPLIAPPKEN